MMARRILLAAMVIAALVVFTQVAQSQQTSGVLRANAQHEIVLDQPAMVGNVMVPAGTYKVHSHVSDGTHQVHFMREMTLTTVHPESSSVVVYDEAAKANCDTQLSANAPEVTALNYTKENGTMRIVSADVEGESHSHIFGR